MSVCRAIVRRKASTDSPERAQVRQLVRRRTPRRVCREMPSEVALRRETEEHGELVTQ